MNPVLDRWNLLDAASAMREVLPCCGSQAWATKLAAQRPLVSEEAIRKASDTVWSALSETDWQEAFDSHPRIGQQHAAKLATAESLQWSKLEQEAALSDAATKRDLAEANRRYEERFGRIFIVCASGKSAAEILAILEARMSNDNAKELREAAEQQRQITQLRLTRWLGGN